MGLVVGGMHWVGPELRDVARAGVREGCLLVVGIARACRQGGCEARQRRGYGSTDKQVLGSIELGTNPSDFCAIAVVVRAGVVGRGEVGAVSRQGKG